MQITLIVLGIIAALVVIVLVVGWTLPVKHTASVKMDFSSSPEAIWAALTEVESFPSWRPDLKAVEPVPKRDGQFVWREISKRDEAIDYAWVRQEPMTHLVSRIVSDGLPFGGSWRYRLGLNGDGGTSLTITEEGEVYNPIFRFVSRFIIGHTSTMATFMEALKARLGEN